MGGILRIAHSSDAQLIGNGVPLSQKAFIKIRHFVYPIGTRTPGCELLALRDWGNGGGNLYIM